MGYKENDLKNEILSNMPPSQRLFRINSGMGWAGQIISNKNGRVVLKNARPFHGAPEGWPDLSGWSTVEITPDMVGQRLAVFTGLELKATGDQSTGQKIFASILKQMGGIYRVIRNIGDYL